MSGPILCRECGESVAGKGNLSIGIVPGYSSTPKGGSFLCVSCITSYQRTDGIPSLMVDFIPWYHTHKVITKPTKEAMSDLQEQNRLLRAVLKEKGFEIPGVT